ncbi:glycosyltransferase 52 family protein [Vibrio sp. A2-1]|uniref:glycosyltransferase 52 family protein n=1 Tax=Vibrio sp. A2-1 TaxID=2912252 RepID=UPI001F1AA1AD|nr:glycosyltransferase 52 family protein [Vibrio sp. A2-1]MCF7487670.1 glycosyltransferase 52 family protein [Vibrio sp. A2-1]
MNLFLVTSPFQYICANEAKAHYKTKNNILLLVEQPSEPGLSQQKKIVNESEWDHVIKIPRVSRSKHVPNAIKEIKSLINASPIQHFFHAEYMAWRTKLIIRNLPISKEVYFDDGTLTVNEYEESIRTEAVYYRPRLIQDLLIRLKGCEPIGRLSQSKNLELFTVFDIKNPKHHITKNELTVFKKKYKTQNLFDEKAPIGFIGQGAIGHKRRKTIEQYISEIKHFSHESQKPILYFPHRTESGELRKEVEKIPNLRYHASEFPLEIELVDKQIKLSSLVGILSTVQYTSTLLYKDMPIFNLESGVEVANIRKQSIVRTDRLRRLFIAQGIKSIKI